MADAAAVDLQGPALRLARALRRLGFDRDVFLLLPVLVFIAIFFVWPFVEIGWRSLYKDGFTLVYYAEVMLSGTYAKVVGYTFRIALLVTVCTTLVAFPIAFVMAATRGVAGHFLVLCVTMPLMTSAIVRSFAWIVAVGRESALSRALLSTGLVSEPPQLLYNQGSVVLGTTYVMIPFMTLTLYSVMRGINQDLIRVAYALGASRWFAFRRVYLPLCLPGLVGGAILVFIMSLGFYVTPALMGGPSDVMMAMVIAREIEVGQNWPLAAAMATVLLCLTSVGLGLCARMVRIDRLLGSKV